MSRLSTDGRRTTECEDRARILKQNSQFQLLRTQDRIFSTVQHNHRTRAPVEEMWDKGRQKKSTSVQPCNPSILVNESYLTNYMIFRAGIILSLFLNWTKYHEVLRNRRLKRFNINSAGSPVPVRYALKNKYDIIWEFFPNVGPPPPPPFGNPLSKKSFSVYFAF